MLISLFGKGSSENGKYSVYGVLPIFRVLVTNWIWHFRFIENDLRIFD
jgi:hypothetical protein